MQEALAGRAWRGCIGEGWVEEGNEGEGGGRRVVAGSSGEWRERRGEVGGAAVAVVVVADRP